MQAEHKFVDMDGQPRNFGGLPPDKYEVCIDRTEVVIDHGKLVITHYVKSFSHQVESGPCRHGDTEG